MDCISLIKEPIKAELEAFIDLFNTSLTHAGRLQEEIFANIRGNAGKRMRPMLMLLVAKAFGQVNQSTLEAAVGLELLHTASLVHDDVVDESPERRGMPSVNSSHGNKVAVLVGDYILSTSLLHIARTGNLRMVSYLSGLGQTLSDGEILQLVGEGDGIMSEEGYYRVIRMKTAALFEACSALGALSVGVEGEPLSAACEFGSLLGTIFQIRDDIFDYFDSAGLGKPTGSDMAEGKLTLPVIHALGLTGDGDILSLAGKVRKRTIDPDGIRRLIDFAKLSGGIEYARESMEALRGRAQGFIDVHVGDGTLRAAFRAYLDFVMERDF